MRLLDTSASGSSLLADSRQVVSTVVQAQDPTPSPTAAYSSSLSITLPTCQPDSIITPDGSAVVCGTIAVVNAKITASGLTEGAVTEFREYSTATGKIARILGQWRFASVAGLSVEVLWSNPSGSVLIAVIPNAAGGRVGVISGNTFTPLPAQVAPASALSGTW